MQTLIGFKIRFTWPDDTTTDVTLRLADGYRDMEDAHRYAADVDAHRANLNERLNSRLPRPTGWAIQPQYIYGGDVETDDAAALHN